MADKIGSCTGDTDWRLSEVQSKSEVFIFWNITSYWSVWISLNNAHPNYTEKTSKGERIKLLKTAIIEND